MRFIFIVLATLILSSVYSQDDYTDKMAKEHQNDSPVATPIAQESNLLSIKTAEVTYAKFGQQTVQGFLAEPSVITEKTSGIIVIHEWWGLNDNVKAMAQKLAKAGYVALAVDMYGGAVAKDPQEARKYMKKAMKDSQAGQNNLKQAYAYLKNVKKVHKVGSVGWCFGGHWSLRTGLTLPKKLNAMVIYYGRLVTDKEQLKGLQMPILGLFGELDKGIPVKSVRKFEKALQELKKDVTIHIYPNANHAFANPSGTRYNEEAANSAWQKTLAFFTKNL